LSRQSGVDKLFSSNYVSYVSNYAVSGKEEFMYTGKSYDSATGLYYEGARYYDPTTGRFVTQDSVTGTQEDPMSLNRYMYARDNPMKIVDLAGHEWWNPVAAITSTISAVTTTVTSVASGVTNAWNSLPPSEQQAIEVTVVVAAASVAVVATAGLAAPVVAGALSYVGVAASASTVTGAIVSAGVGAAVSAGASLGAGLYLGNANPNAILSAATIGAASGGAGAVVGILGNAAIGAAATFADQQINSFATTGHWGAITPM
jgi:RHS repeat-associated protein